MNITKYGVAGTINCYPRTLERLKRNQKFFLNSLCSLIPTWLEYSLAHHGVRSTPVSVIRADIISNRRVSQLCVSRERDISEKFLNKTSFYNRDSYSVYWCERWLLSLYVMIRALGDEMLLHQLRPGINIIREIRHADMLVFNDNWTAYELGRNNS